MQDERAHPLKDGNTKPRMYSFMAMTFGLPKNNLNRALGQKYGQGHFFWGDKLDQNAVRKIREKLLLSKAELARKAGVSPITIDRVEKGMACRMETKRKIIFAFGFDLPDKEKVFPGA